MNYIFSIAGIKYRVLIDKEIKILERHFSFLNFEQSERNLNSEECLHTEANLTDNTLTRTIRFEVVPALPPLPEDAILEQYRYYSPKTDGKTWFIYSMEQPPYAYSDRSKSPEEIDIFLSPEGWQKLNESNVLTLLMETETLLCANGGLMMHGCLVETHGGGILFTGPSGIGKSTQGRLWEEYEDARVLNGDRAGLVKNGGVWYAWGLPFAGSSDIFINQGTSLNAIVVLEQGPENKIRQLDYREAFSCLYPQSHLHHWSRSFMEQGTTILTEIMCSIPVYKLICTPDQAAVELVRDTVFNDR